MCQTTYHIPYQRIDRTDWDEALVALEQAALEAASRAYAPYSHFHVGAAILLDDSSVVTGCNQENASFTPTICAERTALYSIGAQPSNRLIKRILIVAETDAGQRIEAISPCGVCRQVMMEFATRQGAPFEVVMCGAKEAIIIQDCRMLLPFGFDGSDIPKSES